MRPFNRFVKLWVLCLAACLPFNEARAADHIVLQLAWAAEPEFGGFIAAQQSGLYTQAGLDVEIRFGSAQINATQLLLAGSADFIVGPNTYALNALKQGFPLVVVAAIFQKSPNVLIAHTGSGNDSFEALKGKPLMIAFSDLVTFWPFLKHRFGYQDDQLRPYNFNSGPFLIDQSAVQQGYLTEEPYLLRTAGAAIKVLSLADAGYDLYGSTVITTPGLIAKNPDLVRRFVKASTDGWKRYLNGDAAAANVYIKSHNSHMTDGQIAFAIETMKTSGLVDSGDAANGGIGAMSDPHWARMFAQMAGLGLYPQNMNYRVAYTLKFVGRDLGQ